MRNSQSTLVRLRLLQFLLAILVVLWCSTAARSQDAPQPQAPSQPPPQASSQPPPQASSQPPAPPQYPPGNEFAIWGGYSVGNAQLIGITTNRQLGEFALRYGRTLFDKPRIALQYTLDVIPVETVRQYTFTECMPTPTTTAFCMNGRETVYGGGVNPIGLKLNFRREHRFQPFIASTAGFVASVRPVPVDVPGGTQFNFTFDFQAGVDWFNSSRDRAWRFGYKYQHISNAYRHDFNPGVDFHFIFLSYSFFK